MCIRDRDESVRDGLKECLILPALFPQLFQGARRPPGAMLLFGPLGTGKTAIMQAIGAQLADSTSVFQVSCPDVVSKFGRDADRVIRTLFDVAERMAPSLVVLDEVDAIDGERRPSHVGAMEQREEVRRLKTQLANSLNNAMSASTSLVPVRVVGTTNCPWEMFACRRQFLPRIHVRLPAFEQRQAILRMRTHHMQLAGDVDLRALAAMTEGFSGCDLRTVCRDVTLRELRRMLAGKSPEEIGALNESDVQAVCVTQADLAAAIEGTREQCVHNGAWSTKCDEWAALYT
eukprot:TRINITY_DN36071_c0_g1_i1.p1 TRINITY_DN36071_c0_g1~~TRINITY_DN36071_c0_g1_i1.p1  ORF type:complete len:289 (+),score=47.17 TRINITY_DN36071_c0_g1_i1:63-929(+)